MREVGYPRPPTPDEVARSGAPMTSNDMPHEYARAQRFEARQRRLAELRARRWEALTPAERDEALSILFHPAGPDDGPPIVPKLRSPHPPGVSRI